MLHSYYLGSSLLLRVHLIKDLGFYLSPTLSFKHHLNVTIGKSLKIFGFIKRNTTLFTSATCLRTLYFSLVRFILEYGSVFGFHIWPVFNCALNEYKNCIAFLLNIEHTPHDYTVIRSTLNIPTLASRRNQADLKFITSLLNGTIDSPELLATVSFRVPSYSTRHHSLFSIPTHLTSYGHNQPLRRMLHLLNQP